MTYGMAEKTWQSQQSWYVTDENCYRCEYGMTKWSIGRAQLIYVCMVLSIFRRTDGRNPKVIVWWVLLTHTRSDCGKIIIKATLQYVYLVMWFKKLFLSFLLSFSVLHLFVLALRRISYLGRNPKVTYINIRVANLFLVSYSSKFGINQLGSHPQTH